MLKALEYSQSKGQASVEYTKELVKVEKLLKLGWMIDNEISRRSDRSRMGNRLAGVV
jgi:hypothetical protein